MENQNVATVEEKQEIPEETQGNKANEVKESPKDNSKTQTEEHEVPIGPQPAEEEEKTELSPEEQLKQAEASSKEMYDRYLRLNAEFENFKKRMAKENSDRLKYNNMGLIKELLPAIDSLERAIEHAQKDDVETQGMLEGIQMVYKMIQDALEKIGVSKIKAMGELFDPNCHQAIGMVESETVPENHVVDEYQVGYFLHDRIVRPAMVRVSKK